MSESIIDQLGGSRAVAEALNLAPNAVANWKLPERSIPWKRRPAIAKLAEEKGVPLPDGFWDAEAA